MTGTPCEVPEPKNMNENAMPIISLPNVIIKDTFSEIKVTC